MSAVRVSRATVAVGLDVAIFVVGLLLAVPFVVAWVRTAVAGEAGSYAIDVMAIALVVLMARFPLTIPH